jgi:hypothetical protein
VADAAGGPASSPTGNDKPEKDGAGDDQQQEGIGKRLTELAFQALPAIGGAIGFVGFVALAGGVILWVRFQAAGLPASQAVGVTPRNELVSVGANYLIGFALVGLLAVLLIYLLDPRGRAGRLTRWGLALVVTAELVIAFAFFRDGFSSLGLVAAGLWLALLCMTAVTALAWFAALVNGLAVRGEEAGRLRDLAQAVLDAGATALEERKGYQRLADAAAPDLAGAPPHPGPPLDPSAQAQLAADLAEQRRTADIAWDRFLDLNWKFDREVERVGPSVLKGPLSIGDSDTYWSPEQVLAVLDEREVRPGLLEALRAWWRDRRENRKAEGDGPAPDDPKHERRRRRLVPALPDDITLMALLLIGVMVGIGFFGLVSGVDRAWLWFVWALAIGACLSLSPPVIGTALFGAGMATLAAYDDTVWLTAIVAFAVLLGLVNLGIASATDHFAWYAVAVFLSVTIFGAFVTIVRIWQEPTVQPVALVRKSDAHGMCGIYVTETDKRVYLARVDPEAGDLNEAEDGTGRLFWVPSSEVDVVKIGTLQKLDEAEQHALGLLQEAYADRAHERAKTIDGPIVVRTVKDGDITTVKTRHARGQAFDPAPRVAPDEDSQLCAEELPALTQRASRP